MRGARTSLLFVLIALCCTTASCGGLLQGDSYEGNNTWRRGDGTRFRARAPVAVQRAVAESYTRQPRSGELDVTVRVRVDFTNGESKEFVFQGRGPLGQTLFLTDRAVLQDGQVSVAMCGLSLETQARDDCALLTITCAGPLRYEESLRLPH
jgi:hypothetical protein